MWTVEQKDKKSKAISQLTELDFLRWLVRQSSETPIDLSLVTSAVSGNINKNTGSPFLEVAIEALI